MIDPQALERAVEHHHAGRLVEAENGYRQYLAHNPSNAEVWNNLAVLALSRRDYQLAFEYSSKAVALSPTIPMLHCTRAFALNGLGRYDEGISLCEQVLKVQPQTAPAWFGIAEGRSAQGRNAAAIAAYREALRHDAGYIAAANNLGNELTNTQDFDGAVKVLREILKADPDSPVIYNNLGAALRELARNSEAISCFRTAIKLDPQLASVASSLILALNYTPGTTPQMLADECNLWWERYGAPVWSPRRFKNAPNPDRTLRIGYVSPDFRGHPVGRHVMPLFRDYDRTQVAVYAYNTARTPDAVTQKLKQFDVQWRDVGLITDDQLAAQVEADEIDILVDLSLHTAGNRLPVFVQQPAPVQISYGGYPGSTGLRSIAHHLTDPVLEPLGEGSIGSSEPLFLPDSFWCVDPMDDAPPVNPLPAASGKPFVFGCLHKFSKVNTGVLDLWCRILNAMPTSKLLVLCPAGESPKHLVDACKVRGVSAERLTTTTFVPRPDYLTLYNQIDLVLDTFPYNGHMTAVDSLWMGVPFVTLTGQLPVSRGGASILKQVGLEELIATTPEQYLGTAVALASDLPRLAAIRSSLRARMASSPLTDGKRLARNVESAFRTAWRKWCARG